MDETRVPKIHRVLTGAVSAETAHVQADYPYGRTLRCQRRCYLEHREGFGFRFCTQTSNPKRSGLFWNAVKATTYTPLAVLCLTDEHTNEKGEPVAVERFTPGVTLTRDALERFVAAFGSDFNDAQRAVAAALAASRHLGARTGHRFLVFDDMTGARLTPEPVTAADPLFAAHRVVRVESGYNPPLDAITETQRVSLLDSYRLGTRIRVEYVDTTTPESANVSKPRTDAPAAVVAA